MAEETNTSLGVRTHTADAATHSHTGQMVELHSGK